MKALVLATIVIDDNQNDAVLTSMIYISLKLGFSCRAVGLNRYGRVMKIFMAYTDNYIFVLETVWLHVSVSLAQLHRRWPKWTTYLQKSVHHSSQSNINIVMRRSPYGKFLFLLEVTMSLIF